MKTITKYIFAGIAIASQLAGCAYINRISENQPIQTKPADISVTITNHRQLEDGHLELELSNGIRQEIGEPDPDRKWVYKVLAIGPTTLLAEVNSRDGKNKSIRDIRIRTETGNTIEYCPRTPENDEFIFGAITHEGNSILVGRGKNGLHYYQLNGIEQPTTLTQEKALEKLNSNQKANLNNKLEDKK